MDKLNALEGLNHKVAIYIPSTYGVNSQAGQLFIEAAIKRVAVLFSEWFGGATSQEVFGYWQSETKGLVKESVTIVYAYCDDSTLDAKLADIEKMAEDIKLFFSQEAVSVEIDNRLYFV